MTDFNQKLFAALHGPRDAVILDQKGRDFTRGEIADLADDIAARLDAAGVPMDVSVGVVMRNRPAHAAAMLALIAAGRPMTTIYALQADEAIAREVAATRFGAVIADRQDWDAGLCAAAGSAGSAGLVIDINADPVVGYVEGLEHCGEGPFRLSEGERGIELLSSGTTGPPKRIRFPFRMLIRAVDTAEAGKLGDEFPADIGVWPLAGIGGVCNLVANIVLGRHMALLDKFNVTEWVDAVKRHRPSYVSGPPAVAQMVVDAGVAPEDIASIRYFYGGSAPLSPALDLALEERYGITSIWAYGATEFCGTVISWTLPMHQQFGAAKRGSMGRPLPNVSIRIVDVGTGEPLPAGQEGYLEALVPVISQDWIRTTDLAVIDEDGFVFHRGRGDGAIMRGGFKVVPERIVDVLRTHDGVLDAAVIGMPDARLGAVPIAIVEPATGKPRPNEAELIALVKGQMLAFYVPARVLVMERLPRTASLKVDLGALRRHVEQAVAGEASVGATA